MNRLIVCLVLLVAAPLPISVARAQSYPNTSDLVHQLERQFETDLAMAAQHRANAESNAQMLAGVLLVGWLISMIFAAHLGGQRNAGTAGLFLGFLFGPVGMLAAGLLDGRPHCCRCGGRQNVKRGGSRYDRCEHCGHEEPAPIALPMAEAIPRIACVPVVEVSAPMVEAAPIDSIPQVSALIPEAIPSAAAAEEAPSEPTAEASEPVPEETSSAEVPEETPEETPSAEAPDEAPSAEAPPSVQPAPVELPSRESNVGLALGTALSTAQRSLLTCAVIATVAAPLLLCLVPQSIGGVDVPLVGKLCILAACWLAIFKLAEVALEWQTNRVRAATPKPATADSDPAPA